MGSDLEKGAIRDSTLPNTVNDKKQINLAKSGLAAATCVLKIKSLV